MEAGEKYWSVLGPIWDSIDISSPDSFDRTFKAVPRKLGSLYAAHFCQSEVCNGGFTQFFWNSTGVLAPEAADAFGEIGQHEVANVVQRAMSIMGSPYARDRASRWSALARLSGAPLQGGRSQYTNVRLFEPLEKEFYSLLRTEAGGFETAADRYAVAIEMEGC
jgi:Domain of unknown function (DUF4375)